MQRHAYTHWHTKTKRRWDTVTGRYTQGMETNNHAHRDRARRRNHYTGRGSDWGVRRTFLMRADSRNNFLVLISTGGRANWGAGCESWFPWRLRMKLKAIKENRSRDELTQRTHTHTFPHSAELAGRDRQTLYQSGYERVLENEGTWQCVHGARRPRIHLNGRCVFLCMCANMYLGEMCAHGRKDSCVLSIHWPHITPQRRPASEIQQNLRWIHCTTS